MVSSRSMLIIRMMIRAVSKNFGRLMDALVPFVLPISCWPTPNFCFFYLQASSKSELQLHSHGFLENQSLVLTSPHLNKSESKLLEDTQTEVSLVTGLDYNNSNNEVLGSTVLKGVLWQQRDKVFSRWKERYFVLTSDYLQCFKKSSPSVMHSAASEMGRFIFKLKLTEVSSHCASQ